MNSQTKVTAFIACLFILSLFSLPTQAYDTEQGTQNWLLTELDFDQAIKENKYVLVNFHALWCRYSKKLKPEWEKVSEHFKNFDDIKIAKVEAYDEKKLAEQYEIDGFPTIKLFIDGQPHDYSGERTESHIIEFVNRKLKKELSSVSGKSDVDAKLKEYEWVGVYTSGNDIDAVKNVAFDFQDIYFVKSIASDVKQGASDGQFVLYSNITGDHVVFSGSMEEKDLRDFLNKNKFPSVAKFSKGTAEQIFLSEDPSLILIRDASADSDNAEKAFKDAKGLPDLTNVFMSVANTKDEISKLLAQNLGVSTNDLPVVVIVRADRERIRKYKMDDKKDITKDNVLSFYRDYKNKKAQRIYLSEEPPAENKDLVKKVVTKTFESMVLDKNTDVLLLIWAPWCGHCRAMMPVYDNVARKTREVPNFLVAKIDASVNDLEGFGLDIVEYPTILFFTRNNKADPIEFKGERNEYVFNEFIRSHAAVDLARMKGPNPFDKNEL